MRSSVADFEVVDELPVGTFGLARYRCRAPGRLRTDVVEVVELDIDASGWQQLMDSVARVIGAGGDGVIGLLEIGPDLDRAQAGVYLTTEASSGSLANPPEPMSEAAAIACLASVAETVHALHESGIAHSAIAPQSVLATERGWVIAPPPLDLATGVMRRIVRSTDAVTIDPDLLCGEMPSRTSDIWSLGATLHAALSSQPLFPGIEGDDTVTALQRVLYTRPEIDASMRPELLDLVRSCLDPDPTKRPWTALDVAERLRSRGAAG